MGLGPSAVKLYLELWQRGMFKDVNSVVETGSQELHLPLVHFEELVAAAGVPDYKREDFRNLSHWPGQPRCSSRHFYRLLGVEDYLCIDLNKEHGAMPLDLNLPFEDRLYYGRFDLVTDHGTNEHAFNVGEAYRTMHRLCKQEGLIVIIQGVYGGNGYYNFDLAFFEGLAAANNYKVIFSSYIVCSSPESQFHIPLSRELLRVLDWSKLFSIDICYVFQKKSDADFQYPYQGPLLSQVQGNCGYKLQFLLNPPSRTYIPLFLEGMRTKTLLRIVLQRFRKRLKLI